MVAAGATTNISWILDVFEESTATTDGPSGASSTASLQSDLDIGMVRVPCWHPLGIYTHPESFLAACVMSLL